MSHHHFMWNIKKTLYSDDKTYLIQLYNEKNTFYLIIFHVEITYILQSIFCKRYIKEHILNFLDYLKHNTII